MSSEQNWRDPMDEIKNHLRATLEEHLGPVEPAPLDPARLGKAARRRTLIGVTAVIASVALIVAGVIIVPRTLERRSTETSAASNDEHLPTVGIVRCTDEGTVVDTPEIRATTDGVRLRILNESDARFFELRSTVSGENEGGGLDADGVTELQTSASPETHVIGCFRTQDVEVDAGETTHPAFSELTIVDPEGVWNPVELACGDNFEQSRSRTDVPVENENYDEIAREHVTGINDDDQLERPRYPGSELIFETRTVIREGERLARVMFAGGDGEWELLVHACRDSGIDADSSEGL